MIISHKHRFIFIKTKRTAGTSIEIALSRLCGESDVITQINKNDQEVRMRYSGRTHQNLNIPFTKYSLRDWGRFLITFRRLKFHNHMPANQIKEYIPAAQWDSYFTFCFDRHPYSKVRSHYLWRNEKYGKISFEEYISSDIPEKIKGAHFYRDQHHRIMVDKVYQMEKMEAAFEDIRNRLNLTSEELKSPDFELKQTKYKLPVKEVKSPQYKRRMIELFKGEFEELYQEA